MIDPRFPQDRPFVGTFVALVWAAFGLYVLSVIGAYSLGRYHEYRAAVERMEAFDRQAKHWQREAGK